MNEEGAVTAVQHPTVSVTEDALIIRIPWNTVALRESAASRRHRRLTTRDVLTFVEAGRLAHRLGNTRTVNSLKELVI